jgi:GH25 family lysozyme M1 (1,4-beta-N-acetylmuramidase)
MQAAFEYLPAPRSYEQEVLQELYESPELFNQGLPSFEYLLYMEDEELDHFLGSVVHSLAKTAGGVAKAAGGVVKTVGKGLSAVDKVIPMSILTSGLSWTPAGMAARAALGAAQASASGKNVLQGAVRSLAGTPVTRFYVDTAMAAARGENVLKAMEKAAQGQIGDLRQSLQFAAMVAPFVPGLGTGVAAALGAANALAAGQPITEALISAARSAIPGGAVAQFAFDTAVNMAKGKNIGESLLTSARAQVPGGPAVQAAFDAGLALAKGKNIQDAAFAAAGRLLPPSPYAADALSFVQKVASGQNIQRAALSTAGNVILNKIEQQAGPILSRARAAVPVNIPHRFPAVPVSFPRRPIPLRFPIRRELMGEISGQSAADRFRQLVRSGQQTQAITEAVKAGQADGDRLTDMVFYARHPELNGRKVRPDERPLALEWMQIRAALVRPVVIRLQTTRAAAAPASGPGYTSAIVKGSNVPLFFGLDSYSGDNNTSRDWVRARNEAHISFAIFESNWGILRGAAFSREWAAMKAAGLVRGAYLFLRLPNPVLDRKNGQPPDPVAQARAFINTVGTLAPGDLPPSLDVEVAGGLNGLSRTNATEVARRRVEFVRAACKTLKDFYKVAPILYTSLRVWQEELLRPALPELIESPLWAKDYPFKAGKVHVGPSVTRFAPRVPPPWGDSTNWWIHQYQGDAIGLPGFEPGNVDMNRFHTTVRGDSGERVKWVQRRLGIAQNGIFDDAMEAGLRVFQVRNGLPASPLVDPRTFAYLCWSNP